jgi:hypothetical protein
LTITGHIAFRPSTFSFGSPFALRPSPFALRPSPFALRPSPFALRSLHTIPRRVCRAPHGPCCCLLLCACHARWGMRHGAGRGLTVAVSSTQRVLPERPSSQTPDHHYTTGASATADARCQSAECAVHQVHKCTHTCALLLAANSSRSHSHSPQNISITMLTTTPSTTQTHSHTCHLSVRDGLAACWPFDFFDCSSRPDNYLFTNKSSLNYNYNYTRPHVAQSRSESLTRGT